VNAELLVPVVGASLAGSLHCALMCGGLVAVLPGKRTTTSLFHLGRFVAYTSLGAAAGALGTALDLAGKHAGLGQIAALLCGSLVLVFGLGALLSSQGVKLPLASFGGHLSTRLAGLAQRIDRPEHQALFFGASTAFLPCGWLYAFVLAAAGTASPLAGALVMVAFFAGTLPALVGVGLLVPRLLAPIRRHVPLVSATLLVVLGLFSILYRVDLPSQALSVAAGTTPTTVHAGALGKPSCH